MASTLDTSDQKSADLPMVNLSPSSLTPNREIMSKEEQQYRVRIRNIKAKIEGVISIDSPQSFAEMFCDLMTALLAEATHIQMYGTRCNLYPKEYSLSTLKLNGLLVQTILVVLRCTITQLIKIIPPNSKQIKYAQNLEEDLEPLIVACNQQAKNAIDTADQKELFAALTIPWGIGESYLRDYKLVASKSVAEETDTAVKIGSTTAQQSRCTTLPHTEEIPHSVASAVYNEQICTCIRCTAIKNSDMDRMNKEAGDFFKQKTSNLTMIANCFRRSRQNHELLRFLFFTWSKETKMFLNLHSEWKLWVDRIPVTPPGIWTETSLPSRLGSHASLVRGLCEMIRSSHLSHMTDAKLRSQYLGRDDISTANSDHAIKNLAELCVRLSDQASDLMDIQYEYVGRISRTKLPSGLVATETKPSNSTASASTVESACSLSIPITPADPDCVKQEQTSTASHGGTREPIDHAVASSSEVAPKQQRQKSTESHQRRIDTVFDWELASKEPRPSQWEDEDHPSNKAVKTKTRGLPGLEQEEVDEQEPASVEPVRRKWVFKDAAAYETMRIMFPLPGEKDKSGTMTWNQFCHMMSVEPLLFSIIQHKNVAYTFQRPAMDGLEQMSFTLHKPHTKQYVMRNIVWNWKHQLGGRFNWEATDFVLEED